ncbi:MAG: family 43 glycosylhydrolase [Prevotella sp.]|nr:family 43 glycosylhydrolase [Prevotella sp.]
MKQIITLVILMAMSLKLNAQYDAAVNFKKPGSVNPISGCVFCADPTALEYNGRLYVYGSNDHQQFIKNGKKGENGYGDIKSLVVFSTDDMVNWTFHGTIDVAKLCSSWTGNPWYKGFMNSWAPSVTWRTTEDGKEEFFLYFANTSHGVGVLKANSPVGPFTSPLKASLINRDTPGALPCNWIFDPGVVIDENGTGWLSFGGGDPNDQGNNLQPNNARIVKLKPSMVELDGSAVKIPAPYHFEASELNIMDGKFVYTYCSNWANRSDADWNKYKQEQGISVSKPETCTMCYMVSDTPMQPDSWKYKGVYGPHPGSSPNNHSHLHKYQGNYYHIFHNGSLLQGMKDNNGVDANASTYRSICVAKATVDEATQTINKVDLSNTGVTPIKPLDPYQLQQAETMASCGGVNYEDFKNIKTITSKNTMGNDASENMYIKMAPLSWTAVRNVDFGENGARTFVLRAKGSGTVEFRLGKNQKPIATIEFSSSSTTMEDHVFEVDPTVFKGTKNLFFIVFTQADGVQFDAWQFFETAPSGITSIPDATTEPSARYDLNGRRLSSTSSKGLVIEQYKDNNGVTRTRKRVK